MRIEKPPADLQTVTLGDSDKVRVGDYVLAIGNPLGLGQTVTMGIVSAKNRVIGEKLGDIDPRYEDFIQTDAAINQGNSGGPLFNFRGEVIAINAAIINPGVAMNVGFAIPINLARQIADQIRKSGKVARGFLGVSGEDFTPERAAEMHVPYAAGALINAVGRGTPAAAAGLRPNDVVVECAGKADRRLPAPDGDHRAAAAGREGEARAVAAGAARRDGGDAREPGRRAAATPCWASSCARSSRANRRRSAWGRGRGWRSPPSIRAVPPAACWRRGTCCSASTAAESRSRA